MTPRPRRRLSRPGGALRHLNTWAVWMTASVVVMSLFPLFQSSALTTSGYELQHLRSKRHDIEQVTFLMEAEIARLQSLDRMERDARERLKMAPPDQIAYLKTPNAPARLSDSRALPPAHVKLTETPPEEPGLGVFPVDLMALVKAGR